MDAPRRRTARILAIALVGGVLLARCGGGASATTDEIGVLLRQLLRVATLLVRPPPLQPPAPAIVTIGVRA